VKKKVLVLMVPLVLLVALSLVVAGWGSSTTSTTGSTTVTSGSTATGGSSTTASSTATTGGSTGGIPNAITVQMTGDEEVPAVQTAATGTFTLTLSMGGAGGSASSASTASTSGGGGLIPPGLTVSFKLEVNNITDANAAHIHLGAKGQNGPVIYPLFTGPQKNGSFSGVLAEGALTEANLTGPYQGKSFADLVGAVLAGQCYVNVHTAANPNGEIRGQILITGLGGSSTTAAGGAGASTPTTTTGTSSGGY
jgi:hypothetical protein